MVNPFHPEFQPGIRDDSTESMKIELQREMGTFYVVMLGFGAMVGASIFILGGIATGIAGSSVLIAILLNYIVSIITGLNYAEASSHQPEVGGGYVWVKNATRPSMGFIAGWWSWLGHCIACSFYVIILGHSIQWLYGVDDPNQPIFGNVSWGVFTKVLVVFIALFFLWINHRGIQSTGIAGTITVTIQILIMTLFSFLAMYKALFVHDNLKQSFSPIFADGYKGIIVAMSVLFIAFEGYEICAQTGEEAKNPEETIPKAIIFSLTLLTITYFIVFLAAIMFSGSGANSTFVSNGERGLIETGREVIPIIGLQLMILAMCAGAIATLNATIYSPSRVAYALARDNLLPSNLTRLHAKNKTPFISIWTSGGIILGIALFIPLTDVAASADILFLCLFAAVNYSVIVLRKRYGKDAFKFRAPFFPALPIFGLITKVILAVFLYLFSPFAWYLAIVWTILGYCYYKVRTWYLKKHEKIVRTKF